jgi:21S rRNA (uridine2791-2'-O)-methyltransferase
MISYYIGRASFNSIFNDYYLLELPWIFHHRPSTAVASKPKITQILPHAGTRSSSSSTRWKSRQGRDSFAREAKVQGLKSRAAFKLLEIDAKYRLFKKGQTVVDIGYAPGSWSQVALERTKPTGRVVGIDIIPAQPPKGVSTIQGNFLSAEVQVEVKRFLLDPNRGRPRQQILSSIIEETRSIEALEWTEDKGRTDIDLADDHIPPNHSEVKSMTQDSAGKMVDVVLSDMSAPWEQTTGFWKKSDLCAAALRFSYDTLRVGGHFVCKFYQGAEDKQLEGQLRRLFGAVHREKPESSRSESKEAYFVALRRKGIARSEDYSDLDQNP